MNDPTKLIIDRATRCGDKSEELICWYVYNDEGVLLRRILPCHAKTADEAEKIASAYCNRASGLIFLTKRMQTEKVTRILERF